MPGAFASLPAQQRDMPKCLAIRGDLDAGEDGSGNDLPFDYAYSHTQRRTIMETADGLES